jgi:trimeric autotransporter adhesin
MTTLTISGTAADDTIVITATGADSGSYSVNGGPAVAFSGVTQVVVTGEDGNDTLTIVNPDGSLFAPTNGISYDGGGDPADALELLGGTASDLTYTVGATHDAGTLTYTGDAGTQTVAFAGIAPITDTVAAANLIITGSGGADAITVTDGGLVNGFQTTQVGAATFESIRFANKTSVTINGNGGADTLAFNNPTVAAGLSTLAVVNVGAVTQTGAVNYTNLSLNTTGPVTLTGSNDVTNLAAAVSGAGSVFSFNDVDDITLTSVGGVNGISTNNGAISITTANGPVLVANTAAGADVNAGTGLALLSAGSSGATDFAVQVGASANVTGTAGVILVGDHIDLMTGATVNAGAADAVLNSYNIGTLIDLGGADAANTLGLTDAELDGITAGSLRIGDFNSGRISFTAAITPAGTSQLELTTGADIIDGNAPIGADVTVARLAMSAGTGIGVTGFTHIDTNVGQIEAQTTTGGMRIASEGAVTVGGVTGLTGLRVVTSGDVQLDAGGTITLADLDGDEIVAAGSSSGNVFLTASGVASTITTTVDNDAVTASRGSITLAAGQDILLGTVGTNHDNDVLANGSVTLSAGRNIVIDGFADVWSDAFFNNTGGGVTAVAHNNLVVFNAAGTDGSIGALGNGGGSVTLMTGANELLTISATSSNAVFSNSGNVTINADRVAITSPGGITAQDSVTIQPVSTAWAVDLGSPTDGGASVLELSDAELDRIFTDILRIGRISSTGNMTISSQISPNNIGTLTLSTGGGIVDGTAGQQTDIIAGRLALQAGGGIGHADFLDVAATNLRFNNFGMGDVNISAAGVLALNAVDGVPSSSNAVGIAQVVAGGALTVAANVTAGSFLNLSAGDTAAAGDNLTVLAGVTVQSTGASVQLAAGDDVTAEGGSTIQSPFSLLAFVDSGSLDGGVGGTINLNGTVVATDTSIVGSVDNDTLNGTPLVDSLNGAAGADVMSGGAGNDFYFVDGGDAVIENAGQGTDTVFATTHFTLPANVETLSLQGAADLQGYGNTLANTITGNSGSNLIDGGGGADAMNGGAGNDTYFVDNTGDSVMESAGQGNDAVFASVNYGLTANVETLVLQGGADLQGFGNGLVNSVFGNSGNNLIDGGGSADAMAGGIGNDTYFVDNAGDAVIENAARATTRCSHPSTTG